jgi:5-formyltetrahydrofolate cyclo-ligase
MDEMPRPGELRERIWSRLMSARAAVYPLPPHGHHPNFRGASKAAARLIELLFAERLVREGARILCYPDYVLKPLRKGLLERSVDVVVPAKYGNGYRLLESGRVNPAQVASIAGAEREGEACRALPEVVLVCAACVGVGPKGELLDKGYGFAPPDACRSLPWVTLAHPLQLVGEPFVSERRVRFAATPTKVMNLSTNASQHAVD